jgi:glycosyltransferase involved in cell wall biosynthesis
MRVLFVLPYPLDHAPGQRYRVEQWLPRVRAAGIECHLLPLLTPEGQRILHSTASPARKALVAAASLSRALARLPRCGQYDAIWLHRYASLAGPPIVERLMARLGAPILYDFDDAIWMTDTTDANRRWGFLKCAGKTAELCRMASAVVVGNETLAEYAREHNANVWVVPSTVDTDRYLPREHSDSHAPIVIGWSGSPTTVKHLCTISGALRRVSTAASVELRVMGGQLDLPGVTVSLRGWSPRREVEEVQQFDIGLMPLPDDPWCRAKCGMKALLYMAAGVPAIVSPVGVNTTIIKDGVNGLLAATEEEWTDRLLGLVRSVKLRRRLGKAGRATVEAHYSLRVHACRVVEILQSLASMPRGLPALTRTARSTWRISGQ